MVTVEQVLCLAARNGTAMRKVPAACVCVALCAFTGCGTLHARHSAGTQPKSGAEMQQRLRQTPEWQQRAKEFDRHKATAAAILMHATRVQVFGLASRGEDAEKQQSHHQKPLGTVGTVPYYAPGMEQTPAFAAKLGSIILDPKIYPFPGQSIKQCFMEPGVGIRVWRGRQFVDVLLCFSCNQVAVMEHNPAVPETEVGGWIEGRCYVAGDFDLVRPELAALAKQALPNDADIQSISSRRTQQAEGSVCEAQSSGFDGWGERGAGGVALNGAADCDGVRPGAL